ncbi:MAG: hypothetical protein KIT84_44265 [Labilithrix sp.]|nr:hypothetical protein [Labilithrix sp.]MCW5818094.1 hypothetical protein [Labilithrix sp.]
MRSFDGLRLVTVVGVAAVCACAAVTGLSDYELVDDPDAGVVGEGGASSSGAASSSGDVATPIDPSSYVRAKCALQKRCLPDRFRAYFADDAACEGDARTDLEPATTQAQYDACASKLASATCAQRERDFAECDFDPPGTLPDDAGCSRNGQCASGRCKRDPGVDCGKCAERLALGAECTGGLECQDDLYCASATKTCTKYGGQNASCTFGDGSCAADHNCVGNKCLKTVGIGEACTGSFPSSCRSNLSCVDGKCVEDGYATNVGDTCGFQSGGKYVQCVRLHCPLSSPQCLEYGKQGDACDNSDFTKAPCGSGLACTDGTCAPRVTPPPPPVCPP